jgi:hypothetical protein
MVHTHKNQNLFNEMEHRHPRFMRGSKRLSSRHMTHVRRRRGALDPASSAGVAQLRKNFMSLAVIFNPEIRRSEDKGRSRAVKLRAFGLNSYGAVGIVNADCYNTGGHMLTP